MRGVMGQVSCAHPLSLTHSLSGTKESKVRSSEVLAACVVNGSLSRAI